jgi:opacity protein-like surface antigen
MRKAVLSLVAATALAGASAANAAITIGTTGTTSGTMSVTNVDSPTPNRLTFDTIGASAGTVTSFFDFSESFDSTAVFAIVTTDGMLTLEQLLPGGGGSAITQVMGTGNALTLNTGLLTPGVTYRFTYTGNLTTAGNISGNATFTAAAVPEPATWGLMLIGFGGIGLAMRRRRRPVLAQVA